MADSIDKRIVNEFNKATDKKGRLRHTADSVLLMRIKQHTESCTGLLSTVHWRCESGATGTLSVSWVSQRLLEIDTAGMALITLFTK